jgi:hypothetical protein
MNVGGFDPALVCNEGSEILWRVKRAGHRVEHDRKLIVYARDHRRLRQGKLRKTTHTLTRCALLYTNLLPARWRHRDWGYWNNAKHNVLMDTTTAPRTLSLPTMMPGCACLMARIASDTLSNGCARVMTLKDGNAEFTGIKFLADGKSFVDLSAASHAGRLHSSQHDR